MRKRKGRRRAVGVRAPLAVAWKIPADFGADPNTTASEDGESESRRVWRFEVDSGELLLTGL